nr:hypothetical protein [Sporomusa silvacetica]
MPVDVVDVLLLEVVVEELPVAVVVEPVTLEPVVGPLLVLEELLLLLIAFTDVIDHEPL